MRRPIWIAPALCALYLALGAASAQQNFIQTPGFEALDPDTGFAQNWEPVYWSNPHGTVELSDDGHSGERSVVLIGLPRDQITDAGKRNNHLVGQSLGDAITGARKLVLKAYVKTDGDGEAYCSVMTYDREGNQLQYHSSRRYMGQADWGLIVWQFATAPETASLQVYLRNGGEGRVWFDDVSLAGTDDVLENDLARVLVEPLVGGRIRSFLIKSTGEEKTVWQGVHPGGMAAEIVPAEEYPGELRDAPYEIEVLQPNRRVLLRHRPANPDLAGLVFEKEMALGEDSATVDVLLRVRNTGAEPRNAHVRAQNCLPPTRGTFTWPCEQGLRVYQPAEHILKGSMMIEDLREGWFAYTDPVSQSGVVMLFDLPQAERGHLYLSRDLYTIEWYYRPVDLAAGETWETSYTIAPVMGAAPVVAAGSDVAIGLDPVKVGTGQDYSLSLFPIRGPEAAQVAVTGRVAAGPELKAAERLSATGAQPALLKLPWQGKRVESINVSIRTDAGAQDVTLSAATINDKPLHELPPPPTEMAEFPAATGFFPYGEYYRGYVGTEAGTQQDAVARQLRAYRRNYLNTYILGEGYCLGPLRAEGKSWFCDLARKFHMRLIPKGEMMRRFERTEDGGIKREVFAEETTREQIIERLTGGGDLDLRRSFAEAYGDIILAYDLSDEPGPEYIPYYMQLQNIYREVDPEHPVITILNLNRTAYLPYMPVYYGDEYPIRNARRGGRNPWAVAKTVRFCSTHTRAPVWVMLQAFGGLPEYTWQLPNEPEMRLTLYLVVANGGKGITFHGSFSPPCWRYHHHYFYTTCDSWGVAAPAWRAMREAGRHLTAIGPSLLHTEVNAAEPFSVECEHIGAEEAPYQGPAITVGVLEERSARGRFLVAVNMDVEKAQSATLVANPEEVSADEVLFDLYDLAPVGAARALERTVELRPGDGRIFYCGPQAAGEAVSAAVHGKHYENERAIYEMDAELAAANGLDIANAAGAANQGARAHAAGDHIKAHAEILEAQKALAAGIAADVTLGSALDQLQKALELLSEVAGTYRESFDTVAPPEGRESATRYKPWKNDQDPKMQQYVDETAACFCARLKLEDRMYAGEAAAVGPELAQLLEASQRLHDEAIPYVLSRKQ